MQAKRGFTLVEILIVVVILGILAAIVIPQFTQASTEAKENSLCSDLQSLRSQIELYKCQHNDIAPTQANFINQMVYCTDIAGVSNASKARDATHQLGPYLETVPENPFNKLSTVEATAARPAAGDDSAGWSYIEATGEIFADDHFTTATGVAHSQL
jgi:general secretion pathway protein G